MPSYQLHEVFGVFQLNPKVTYVESDNRSIRLASYLNSGRHCLLYGPSKQGKSILRKHAFNEKQSVVIRCGNRSQVADIYTRILSELDVQAVLQSTSADTRTFSFTFKGGGKAGIPGFIQGQAELGGTVQTAHQDTTVTRTFGQGPEFLEFVVAVIKASRHQIIIEDFHYLPRQSKIDFCHDLRVFNEQEVSLVLIGVWEQSQFLTVYNGDLDGRYEEIRLDWPDTTLNMLLSLGQNALNIRFSDEIKRQVLESANGNIGLVQRMAYQICEEANVLSTVVGEPRIIDDQNYFTRTCEHICRGFASRYEQFLNVQSEKSRVYLNTARKRKTYLAVADYCVQQAGNAFQSGIPLSNLHDYCKSLIPNLSETALLNVLLCFDLVQSDNDLSPIIASYDPASRMLTVADRQLLFYSRHGRPRRPWHYQDETGEEEIQNPTAL